MKRYLTALSFFAAAAFGMSAQASVNLAHGATVAVPGVMASAEIDLAGGVVLDQVLPFKIMNLGGVLLFKGSLQNRVVRSTKTGELHFYYRILETDASLPGKILSVTTRNFSMPPRISTGYRVDGLGAIAPLTASRSADGSQVTFRFARGQDMLIGGETSKFFELKTTAKSYNNMGLTKVSLISGHFAVLKTAQPAIP